MRVIYEVMNDEAFFEVILSEGDLERFDRLGGIVGEFFIPGEGLTQINVFIRKETLCLLKKEDPKKSFPKTFQNLDTLDIQKNKASQLPYQKLEEKKAPKKERKNDGRRSC
jgi:hypothetical protein